jgi:hypothetical protein
VEDESDERGAVLAVGLDGLVDVVLDHVLHPAALGVVVADLEVALRRRRLLQHQRRRAAQRRHQHLHLLPACLLCACTSASWMEPLRTSYSRGLCCLVVVWGIYGWNGSAN